MGEVAIIFGSSAGLDPKRKQVIDPGIAGRTGFSDNANFGAALVWGQFGGGPEADLAIGAPGDREQGTVTTLLGGPGGLDLASFQRFTLGGIFGLEVRENFMRFGDSLTGGDFDGDRFADIAIGAPSLSLAPDPGSPGDDIGRSSLQNAGGVAVLRGSATGPTTDGASFFRQGREGLDETAESFEQFGEAITAGDLSGDGRAELIVGVPNEGTPGTKNESSHGAVHVIFGTEKGLTTDSDRLLRGSAFSQFGAAVVTGDLQGDGVRDLVVGQPGATVSGFVAAGAVNVFYGTASGLATTSQVWTLDSTGVAGTAAANTRYGSALTAWNFGGTPQADLVVGAPQMDLGALRDVGGIGLLYGSPSGLAATNSAVITQDTVGIADIAETGDEFGSSAY